jgi:hypothetical protein
VTVSCGAQETRAVANSDWRDNMRATVPPDDGLEIFTVQSPTVADRKAPRTDASWIGRVRALPFKPTNLKLVDIKMAVRATLEERAAKPAK